MITYKNIDVQYAPKFDLGLFNQTLDKIDKGRTQAIEAKNKFAQAINALPLNEEGDAEYKQGLLDKFNKVYEDSSLFGNPYYALDEIQKVSGEILGSTELADRIKDQEEYNIWKQGVLNSNLEDVEKDYILEQNKYKFNPVNETIQTYNTENYKTYNKWKPNYRVIEDIDLVKLISMAENMIKPISGYTDDEIYEGKRAEDIRKAIDNILKTNHQYEEYIRQKYNAYKWGLDNKRLTKDELITYTYPDGSLVSYDEYKNRIFNGTAQSMAYSTRKPIRINTGRNPDVIIQDNGNGGFDWRTDGYGGFFGNLGSRGYTAESIPDTNNTSSPDATQQ